MQPQLSQVYRTIRLDVVIHNLANLRTELETAGEGVPLDQMQVNAATMMNDVLQAIGVPEQDRGTIMGVKDAQAA